MFLYIAQLVHQENLVLLNAVNTLLGMLGINNLAYFAEIVTAVTITYMKTLPVWLLLTVIMLIRETHSAHTAKIASSANNIFKKTQ